MPQVSKWLFPVLVVATALSFGGCSCGADTGNNGNGDGGNDSGGNNTGDADVDSGGNGTDGGGGGTDGGGGGTDGGGGGTDGGNGGDSGMNCLTAATVCPGKCGLFSDNCAGIIDCSSAAGVSAGGIACGGGMTCSPTTSMCVTQDAGGMTCTPTESCASRGQTCGQFAGPTTCGVVLNCGPGGTTACTGANEVCVPPVPGAAPQCITGTQACTGSLCSNLPTGCATSTSTQLTGVVVTPGVDPEGDGTFVNRIPVPNAVVYIPANPASALPTIFEGVQAGNTLSCGRCADEQFVTGTQSVLASAITNYRGEFTLAGRIPIGVPFNLVIKVGKWRRVVQIPAGTSVNCMSAALTFEMTRLNRSSGDGLAGTHLPKIAVGTGEVDEMECVLRNMGISDSEFTNPGGAGRIHMYRKDGARMGTCTGNTTWGSVAHACSDSRFDNNYGPNLNIPNYGCVDGRAGCAWSDASSATSNLYGNTTTLNSYDMVVWDCEGDEVQYNADEPGMEAYVVNGGRMFASHFAYTWIENNGTLDQSADWGVGTTAGTDDGYVSLPTGNTARTRANPVKSLVLNDWLNYLGALNGSTAGLPLEVLATPTFTISDARDRAGANVGASTDEWIYRDNAGTAAVQQLSFNTPYGATDATACGRVAYSGFHVALTDNNDAGDYFPNVCLDDGDATLTSQELILAFMLFDLNACVSTGDPSVPPMCTPDTVADVCPAENDACNYVSDGCGGVVNCGSCDPGYYCSGTSCIMAPPPCVPQTCAQLNASYVCGQFPDGCGGIADTSPGANDNSCGTCSGGTPICGPNGTCVGSCTPNANPCGASTCGSASDGCGTVVYCGPYPMGACAPGDTCVTDPNSGVRSCQFIIE